MMKLQTHSRSEIMTLQKRSRSEIMIFKTCCRYEQLPTLERYSNAARMNPMIQNLAKQTYLSQKLAICSDIVLDILL